MNIFLDFIYNSFKKNITVQLFRRSIGLLSLDYLKLLFSKTLINAYFCIFSEIQQLAIILVDVMLFCQSLDKFSSIYSCGN